MKTLLKPLSIAVCSAVALFAALPAISQTAAPTAPQPRITAPIDNSSRTTLTGSRPPRANPADDIGAVSPSLKLQGISLVFSRTPAQQTALDNLVAAQQNPSSPLYHQWLTPDQFAAQFGVADADIAALETWLEQQGFSVDSVSRSRNRIFFSGNAGLVASAFGAPLHSFKTQAIGNQPATTHFAPSADLSVPAALSSSVLAITNLSDFRPRPHVKLGRLGGPAGAQPRFTSGQTGNHFLTPGDVSTIYDITPAYNAGLTGSNQSIAVVGQSEVNLSDISNFQNAVGIVTKTPILTLVPGSGTAEVYANGDEAESDLDLEYSSTIAKGAQVYFVYVGNSSNYSAFNSIEYAIDERIAPVISTSYGECEFDLGQSLYTTYNAALEQAATQGQTVIAASGDDGSTDCYGEKGLTTAEQEALAVDFPGSSQYVTSMGGTEFPAADVAPSNNTYFEAETTTDIISSALSHIPEIVWNDDAISGLESPTDPLASGGGGVSIFTPQPTWQSGTIGGVAIPTPTGGKRMVPDIALDASPFNAPYAFCTSDISFWATAANGASPPYQENSCNDGLRDSSSQLLTVAGGTSFPAPIFAGLVAIINQSQNSTGQGVVNSTLYALAATSAYSTAFHDITSVGNQCTAGAAYCDAAGEAVYAAGTGYDEASGLGSIDFDKLLTAWPKSSTASLASTTTTLTAVTTTPAVGATDAVTIIVAPLTTNAATPTGTIAVVVDGGTPRSLTLASGMATYSFESATAGVHVIVATYSGDGNFGASTGTLIISVGGTTGTGASFALTVPNITIAAGSSGSETLTVTPAGGYTGTVEFSLKVPSNLANFCINNDNALTVTGTAAVFETITLYTSSTTCNSLGLTVLTRPGTGGSSLIHLPLSSHSAISAAAIVNPTPASPWKRLPLPAALAGTLMLVCFRRRSRLLRVGLSLGVVVLLSVAGLGLTACGGGSSSPASPTVPPSTNSTGGTYTLTLIGTDSKTAAITNSTTFTLTVN